MAPTALFRIEQRLVKNYLLLFIYMDWQPCRGDLFERFRLGRRRLLIERLPPLKIQDRYPFQTTCPFEIIDKCLGEVSTTLKHRPFNVLCDNARGDFRTHLCGAVKTLLLDGQHHKTSATDAGHQKGNHKGKDL